jgi:hypothetical protein
MMSNSRIIMEDIISELKQAVKDYNPEAAEVAAQKVIEHKVDPVCYQQGSN